MVPQRRSFLTVPVVTSFVVLAATLAILGVITVTDHRTDAEQQVQSELSAIVDMKLEQVRSWRKERLSDAHFIENNPHIHRYVELLGENRLEGSERAEMLGWMQSMYRNGQYGRIVAFDRKGRVLASVPESDAGPGPTGSRLMERAAANLALLFSDFSVRDSGHVGLDIVVPFYAGPQGKQAWIGSVVLSIDPRRTLYPILSAWPVPSRSAQLMLIRRDGTEIVFLTELRDTSAFPLALRVPIATSVHPAAGGFRGETGLLHGVAFGGRGALAVLRPVPDAGWFIAAQIDEDEVYAPVGEYARMVIAVVGLLIIVGAVSFALFLRKKEADHYRNEYESSIERQALVRHFDYLTRYANDIVMLFDDTGAIREVNNRGETVYRHERLTLMTMNVDVLGFWPENVDEAARIRRELDADANEMHGVLFEADHRRSDGTTFPAEVSARRLTVEGGRFIHAIIRDISERKRAEQALIAAKEHAEEAGTFQRVLLENMSHELRTPMQGILGFARLLLSGARDPSQREMAGNILASGRRLMATLDSILLLSELEAGTLAPHIPVQRIDELVESAAQVFTADAEAKGLAYTVTCHTRAAYATLDPDLFRRALGYLVENAIKFTPSGSVAVIVRPLATGGSDSVSISVTDTGIGIPRHQQSVIFEAFRQASAGLTRDYEGTGLGLTLAGRIAKAMGGVLNVESDEGQGATFTMTFPCVPTSMAPSATPAAPVEPVSAPRPALVRPTVLLVEDNFLNAMVARQFLDGFCDVVHVPDGPRALNVARERQFSLVLMDIHLGAGMDGVEVAEELRKVSGYEVVPIAAVTGYTNTADRTRFEHAGMAFFLPKPYDKSDLMDLVTAILGVAPAQGDTA
jgi:PAS domain S-box-containing protein